MKDDIDNYLSRNHPELPEELETPKWLWLLVVATLIGEIIFITKLLNLWT